MYVPTSLRATRRRAWIRGSLGLALAASLAASAPRAWAEEDETAEGPPPTTVQESKVPIERLHRDPIQKESVAPSFKRSLERRPAWLRDATATLNLRSFYLLRDKFDPAYQEAWAQGGSLVLRSGWIFDRVAFGLGVYGSVPLYAPEDRDGTLLLKPGQEAYGVLGQLYADVKLWKGVVLSAGRKEVNTPYINKNDIRMTPNTFETYMVMGKHGGKDCCPELVWGAGYVTRIKERNDDDFVWMSHDAGVATVDHGVAMAGAKVSTKSASIGAVAYSCPDVLDIVYAEGTWKPNPNGRFAGKVSAQVTYQQSNGDDLLTGADFSTFQLGVKLEGSYRALMLTLGFTSTDDESDMRNPWSSCPGYTSVQVQDFNRAGEEATIVKVGVDLCKALDLAGMSTYALWVHGWDRVAGPNEDEIDLDLQWRPWQRGWKALNFRLRYAYIDQRDTGDTLTDFRFIINYDIQLP